MCTRLFVATVRLVQPISVKTAISPIFTPYLPGTVTPHFVYSTVSALSVTPAPRPKNGGSQSSRPVYYTQLTLPTTE
ncbi:MAG: hypothetical protein K2J80_13285, partial [Oscillospiraceae bacterium]|nr:hypothetical protein [Oscillospiraceae bacterium]